VKHHYSQSGIDSSVLTFSPSVSYLQMVFLGDSALYAIGPILRVMQRVSPRLPHTAPTEFLIVIPFGLNGCL
jgi:hypothetical protein